MLLPTGHSALRPRLDRRFDAQGLRPHVVGEFEYSVLLAVFAARGLGAFPVSRFGAADVALILGIAGGGCGAPMIALTWRRSGHLTAFRC